MVSAAQLVFHVSRISATITGMTVTTSAPDHTWRRFLRFRLRTLLLVMLVIAAPLAWKVNQVRRQRAAVAAIKELGGTANYPSEISGLEPPGPEWLRGLLGNDFFDHVVEVLSSDRSNDFRILEHAAQFHHLTYLRLSDVGASPFTIDGRGWQPLAELSTLEGLDLTDCAISDTDLVYLAGLAKLRYLGLSNTRIHGPGLAHLSRLAKLESLYLSGTPCSGDGLKSLSALPNLQTLWLRNSEITDADLEAIDGIRELKHLNLSRTRVTDVGLETLTRLTKLTSLDVSYTNVTEEGLARLHARLPNITGVIRSTKGYAPPKRD